MKLDIAIVLTSEWSVQYSSPPFLQLSLFLYRNQKNGKNKEDENLFTLLSNLLVSVCNLGCHHFKFLYYH